MDPLWSALARLGWEPFAIGLLLTILAAFVRAVLRGSLVPRAVLEDVRQDRADRVREMAEERDKWRRAHEVSEQTRTIMAQQVERLLSTTELTNQMLSSIKSEGRQM